MTKTEEEEVHRPEITRAMGKYKKWWVNCSCGYMNGPFTSRVAAENDGDEHVLAVVD